MDQIGHDQHADVTAEAGQRLGQGLAVLGTLAEAAARLAAEESRRKERREDQADGQRQVDERRQEAARRAAQEADRLATHAAAQHARNDRRVMGQALDEDWVARAGLFDLATVWRTARAREHEFVGEARAAAGAVEDRLRQMYPRPMDIYDQALADGVPRAEAMRTAAEEMARTPVMRPHRGGRAGTLPAGEDIVGEARFAAALSDEQIHLATGVDPQVYAEELGRLGPGGEAAAQALRDVLAARAGQELAAGRRDAATPDNPHTASFDERLVDGLPRSTSDFGSASRDQATAGAAAPRTAAQLAGEWYPHGLNHPTMPVHVAGRQPANAGTQALTRAAGRSR